MLCIVVLLILLGTCAAHNYDPLKYRMPEPLIQAFRPRGLKVSIPHTSGIKLFAFHGNINGPRLENGPGQLSGDIAEPQDGRWVFQDPDVSLEIGDTICYWAFVLKGNLRYQYTGTHKIADFTPGNTTKTCQTLLTESMDKLSILERGIQELTERNSALEEVLRKNVDGLSLTLTGPKVPGFDAEHLVNAIIKQLKLKIAVANIKENGGVISFDVASVGDKLQLLEASRKLLQNSNFSIRA